MGQRINGRWGRILLGLALEAENSLALFGGKSVACQPDAGIANSLQRLAEAPCCTLGGGGRIVQLVSQTSRQLAQRHQLIALGFDLSGLADAVRHNGH